MKLSGIRGALSYLLTVGCVPIKHTMCCRLANFMAVVKNDCPDVPDVDRPPWNNAASLSSNTTSSAIGNATLAPSIPLLSNSSGSLLQRILPDAIGTS